jgi:hypothetical protein
MLILLTCGPLLLALAAWSKLFRDRQRARLATSALVALGLMSANSLLSASLYLYQRFRPTAPSVPPWEDPFVLGFGMFFFLGPAAMVVGGIAAAKGAPAWLVFIVEVASLPLFALGFLASLAV